MFRLIFCVLATAMLLVCGLVHGYWTDRWYPPTDLAEAAARLEEMPLVVGDWKGETVEVKPTSVEPLLAGHLERRYINDKTGEAVSLVLVVGRSGPVSIHTPDVCYSASGYTITARGEAVVPGGSEQFLTMDAVRTRQGEVTSIRLFWAWNAGQGWITAGGDPRTTFARHRVLHKLYVGRDLTNLGEPTREDPCLSFLETLLPMLDKALFNADS
jgi:Protein of unknown function (DUF3485)